jgi:glutamyl-Q tRNA(Asp) synthetase
MGLLTPSYLHTPLVMGDNGEKLSKQNGAQALNLNQPLQTLQQAGQHLNLHASRISVDEWLREAIFIWRTHSENAPSSKG